MSEVIFYRIILAAVANCRSVGYRQFGMISMAKHLGFFNTEETLERDWTDFLKKNISAKNCNEILDLLLSPAKTQKRVIL
ncbi:MAG: hypothetical protein PHX60_07295 [Giesbergeria sp.]|uniref:hypothetical protein n=1 Tax=Giesbergeria sp. TaxID=2818473 RepID=UPI002620C299|nr:hypothetical protein [Giesbergeria sp.]MDD2609492.1 hypothetical protein [Giesbergeria sp.]